MVNLGNQLFCKLFCLVKKHLRWLIQLKFSGSVGNIKQCRTKPGWIILGGATLFPLSSQRSVMIQHLERTAKSHILVSLYWYCTDAITVLS